MFFSLGRFLLRTWPGILAIWIGAWAFVAWVAPRWETVVRGGQFVFLPDKFPSRQAESLFNRAFPGRLQTSSVVIVVYRDGPANDRANQLSPQDQSFISDVLKPRLEKLLPANTANMEGTDGDNPAGNAAVDTTAAGKIATITGIRTFADHGIGPLLMSTDRQASLVVVELSSDFMELRNFGVVHEVEGIVRELQQSEMAPAGLHLALSGSATLGRDILHAESRSAESAGAWTIGLVVVMLLVIYRAPLLALVPLVTLFIAVQLSLRTLTLLAQAGYLSLFEGLEVYATVITYGPGVDYCLFLIARYRENLDRGEDSRTALGNAIGQVGAAITASAGTVICGIAMLGFAEFGKFREAGIAISFCLVVVLFAILTFTPALLVLGGRWAFWPLKECLGCDSAATATSRGAMQKTPAAHRLETNTGWAQTVWHTIAQIVERHPGLVWGGTAALMLPFAAVGVVYYDEVSYGLVEELQPGAPSVQGAAILKQHFAAGITGPATVLVRNDRVNFTSPDGERMVGQLVERIAADLPADQITDIRSLREPLGRTTAAKAAFANLPTSERLVANARAQTRARDFYVSHAQDLSGHVTRIDLILNLDPFSLQAGDTLTAVENLIRNTARSVVGPQTEVLIQGPTASIRDLDRISETDRIRINVLVVACVFAILILLLRRPGLSLYLIATVLFSFLVTLGITFLVFRTLAGPSFPGLDWTVPIFLFVVLVAVGEDYNIFLMTRIHEEQVHAGVVHGIALALQNTGNIITSCGIIMAGTFCSFMAGSIARMVQLGFALAFGVLLDTFVVRPILVPAYLLMIHRIRPAAAEVPAPVGAETEEPPADFDHQLPNAAPRLN